MSFLSTVHTKANEKMYLVSFHCLSGCTHNVALGAGEAFPVGPPHVADIMQLQSVGHHADSALVPQHLSILQIENVLLKQWLKI